VQIIDYGQSNWMYLVIRFAVIDDDRMLLDGLRAWFGPIADLDLVNTTTSVDAFQASGAVVDVVLLDLNLRDHSEPADNVRRLVAAGWRVVVVSEISDTEYVLATIEAGASGYVTKDRDLAALTGAIRAVAGGDVFLSSEPSFVNQASAPVRPRLSPQERAVLTAYARGSTMRAAARQVGIAYGTARQYLERIKRKYDDVGRPARTKLELHNRLREDRLELDGLESVAMSTAVPTAVGSTAGSLSGPG